MFAFESFDDQLPVSVMHATALLPAEKLTFNQVSVNVLLGMVPPWVSRCGLEATVVLEMLDHCALIAQKGDKATKEVQTQTRGRQPPTASTSSETSETFTALCTHPEIVCKLEQWQGGNHKARQLLAVSHDCPI